MSGGFSPDNSSCQTSSEPVGGQALYRALLFAYLALSQEEFHGRSPEPNSVSDPNVVQEFSGHPATYCFWSESGEVGHFDGAQKDVWIELIEPKLPRHQKLFGLLPHSRELARLLVAYCARNPDCGSDNLCLGRKLVVSDSFVRLLKEDVVREFTSGLFVIHALDSRSRATYYSRHPFLERLDQALARQSLFAQHA